MYHRLGIQGLWHAERGMSWGLLVILQQGRLTKPQLRLLGTQEKKQHCTQKIILKVMWLTKLRIVFCKPQSRSSTQAKKTIYDCFLHCRSNLESVCSKAWCCWEEYSKSVACKLPVLFSYHLHPYQHRITWTTWQEWKHKLRIIFKIPAQSSNINDFSHYNWMKRG